MLVSTNRPQPAMTRQSSDIFTSTVSSYTKSYLNVSSKIRVNQASWKQLNTSISCFASGEMTLMPYMEAWIGSWKIARIYAREHYPHLFQSGSCFAGVNTSFISFSSAALSMIAIDR
jgi:hypothetical protein